MTNYLFLETTYPPPTPYYAIIISPLNQKSSLLWTMFILVSCMF